MQLANRMIPQQISKRSVSTLSVAGERALIRVKGPDARSFLQGYATQDMESALPGSASFTAFLNSKGRAVFEACVFAPSQRDNTVFLDVHTDCLATAMTHLRTYKLRADVSVTDASKKYTVLSALPSDVAQGQTADFAQMVQIAQAAAQGCSTQARTEHICIHQDPRSILLGTKLVVPVEAAGVPEGIEAQGYMPLEWGVDYLNGVSFRKGCYLGQELMARTHFTGQVRKRALPVLLLPGGHPPSPPLFAETLLSQQALLATATASSSSLSGDVPEDNVPRSLPDAAGMGPPSAWQQAATRGALWESHSAQEKRLQGRWQDDESPPAAIKAPPSVRAPTVQEVRAAVHLAAAAACAGEGGLRGKTPPPAPGAALLTGAGRKAGRILSSSPVASPAGVTLGFAVLKLVHAGGVMQPPLTEAQRQGGEIYPAQGTCPADCPDTDLLTAAMEGGGASYRVTPWVPPHFAALQADESQAQAQYNDR